MEKQYDLIIIGGGPGGYVAAIHAAKAGLSAAVVENRRVGGTCLNRGCIPAKAMIHASSLYREAVEGQRFGLFASEAAFDYGEILQYKQETIDGLVGGVEQLLKANGVTLLAGTGTLLTPEGDLNRVAVRTSPGDAGEIYGTENVILASGSKPARIPVPGLDLPHVVDSDGLFALEDAPRSLVIIGGGVIGVEFATVFANLGTEVTIVEALPKLLDNFDKEISQNIKMILKKRGVEAHLNALVKECVPGEDDDVICRFEEKGKEQEISAEYVLVAAGRTPVTEGLFGDGITLRQLEDPTEHPVKDADEHPVKDPDKNAGAVITMNRRFVAVDEHFRTSMPGVYAIGDLIGGIQLAHAASAHGVRAIEEILRLRDSEGDGPVFAQDLSV